jgi:MFS transporter, AAHS family, 4-hydroxybenzoate transporter
MAHASTVNVSELIDRRPLGAAQIRITILCGLVALLDGFDLQSIGLAAPAIASALHIPPQDLGAVFSAALAGLMLGAFGLGPLADRVGRKTVLIGATLLFGVFTVCTAFASSFGQLLVFRFLTGLGLGGAMPSFISLASEYAPRRMRATLVAILWAGFPLGGAVGGFLASKMLPAFGWQSLFYLGGVLPLLLALLLLLALPESVGFLVDRGAPAARIARELRRMFPEGNFADDARYVLNEQHEVGTPIRHLFDHGRASGTILLWISYFVAFLMLVTNSAWSPTLLRQEGVEVTQTALALAAFNALSVLGSGAAGYLITRFGALAVLPATLVGGALAYGLIGHAAPNVAMITVLQSLFGLLLGCASSGLIALAPLLYPTAVRSTGVGWAMGMGRFGSFVGPLVVGALLARHLPISTIFMVIALPGIVAAITAALVAMRQPRAAQDGQPAAATALTTSQ